MYKCSYSCLWCSCWWNLDFSFKSYGKESLYIYCMNVDDGWIMHSWRSCLLDLGFNFHLEFRQYKLKWKIRSLPWFFCVNKLSFLYCLNKTFSSYSNVSSHWLQLLCQSALSWNEDYLQEKSDLQKETRWLSLCSRGRATSDDIGREFCLLWLVWWALQYAHNVLVVLVCKYIYNDLLIWWGFSCYN